MNVPTSTAMSFLKMPLHKKGSIFISCCRLRARPQHRSDSAIYDSYVNPSQTSHIDPYCGCFFRPTQGVITTQYDEELLFLHWFGVRSRTLRLHPENPFLDVFFSHQSPSHGSLNQSSGDLWQPRPTQGPLAVEAFQPPKFTKWRTDRGDLEDPRIR